MTFQPSMKVSMKQKVDKMSTNVGAMTFGQLALKSTTDEKAYFKLLKKLLPQILLTFKL